MTTDRIDALLARVKKAEGLRLTPYKDIFGFWTIGRGHKLDSPPSPGLVWTKEQADRVFLEDIFRASDQFMKFKRDRLPKLNTLRSGVCVEMVFWMGMGGFLKFKRMIAALGREDYKEAALELLDSKIGKDPQLRERTWNLAYILWKADLYDE